MEKYIFDYFKNFFDSSISYQKVFPYQYAAQLKIKFSKDKSLWYGAVTPKEKADELIKATGNDYSKVWQTYCECCFINIDASTLSACYTTEDFVTWLCEKCYNKLKLLSS